MEPPRLDWRTKGLPPRAEGLDGAAIARLGLGLADLLMPAALLSEAALSHNIGAMQAFADRHGARLCPHGKTSMSGELFAMQIAAGAWGLTAATAHHVRIYRRLGVRRILLASQLAAPADIALVLGEIGSDPELDFYALADSAEGADLLAAAARAAGCPRPIQLLVETGTAGGRGGVRDPDSALAVARAIAAAPELALRGVETFEGVRQRSAEPRSGAGAMVDLAVAAAGEMALEGLFAEGPLLLSAGGSAFLDLVAAKLPRTIGGHEVERVIRPGCYVTHDHGLYSGLVRPGAAGLPELRPALEVWGAVLSVPEPGLAIVGVGKRDVSTDCDPPVPLRVRRRDGGETPGPIEAKVVSLWDQHLSLAVPPGGLRVGDLVGFGISHPCATFDRWTALFTVDEDDRVTGAVTTLF